MKQLDELLARVPELQAKAREREKARQAKAEKDSTAVVPAVVQLPLWPDAVRRLPNELLRSALFNARNRIGALDLAVQGSEQVLDSYLRQFQAGRKSWLDLLNAARELAQNEYTLVDARAGLVGAMHRLQLRMGQSPDFP